MSVLDALLERDEPVAERAEVGKPGTNWKQVGPAERKKIAPIVRHYMKDPTPFRSCVRDNRKRFGDRAEQVCAVVKDMGRKTTKWRKGRKGKLAEQAVLDGWIAEVEAAAGRLAVIEQELGPGSTVRLAEVRAGAPDTILAMAEQVFHDRALLCISGLMSDEEFMQEALAVEEAEATVTGVVTLRQVASAVQERARHEVHLDGQHVGYVIERRRSEYNSEPQSSYWQARTLNGDAIASNEASQTAALAALRQHLSEAPSRVRQIADRWWVANPRSYGQTEYQEYPSEDAARHAAGLPPARVGAVVVAQESDGGAFFMALGERAAWDPAKHPRGGKGTPAGGKFVAKGSSGRPVVVVQQRVGAKQDGQFGDDTEAKVRAFQKKHGLQVDGKVGHQTAAAMLGHNNASRVKAGALTASDRKRLTRKRGAR